MVVRTARGRCLVRDGARDVDAASLEGVAVGDEVELAFDPARVVAIGSRRTVLSRPDPHDPRRELVLAANVDVVVIVASIASPPLRPRLVDRYLVAIERGGASPAIALTKIDLADPRAAIESLAPYVAMGVPLFPVSSETSAGLDELRAFVADKSSVFTGHSGVGKSSLVRALDPSIATVVGTVTAHGRGRHTTTGATMHFVETPHGTARIVDTPGLRALGLWDVDAASLAFYFPDLAAHAGGCKFADCSHTHEPKCAVKAAVEAGELSRARYDAYLRIRASITE